jgi:Caspase domain
MKALVETAVSLVLALGLILSIGSAARADRRVALIIGNANYANAGALPSTANDASAIADLLTRAGFDEVQRRSDLGDIEFWQALEDFSKLSIDADVAIFYYSGYALAIGGVDYLVPVDAQLSSAETREDEAISLGWVFRATDNARTLSLIILDACRESPFHPDSETMPATPGALPGLADKTSHDVSPGLAKAAPPDHHALIAFADRPGSVCADGKGTNSPFAAGLVKHIAEPGLDIRAALGKVRDEVLLATGNRQAPSVYGSLNEVVSLAREGAGVRPNVPGTRLSRSLVARDKDANAAAIVKPAPPLVADKAAGAAAEAPVASGGAKSASSAPAPASLSAAGDESLSGMASASAAEAPVAPPAASEVANEPSDDAKAAAAKAAPVEPPQAAENTNALSSAAKPAGVAAQTALPAPALDAASGTSVDERIASAEAPVQTASVATAKGGDVRPNASPSAAKAADLAPDEICKRDRDRLERLRAAATSEEARRFADELGCEKLRPQLSRLIESLGAEAGEEGAAPPVRSGGESPALLGPKTASDCGAAQDTLARLRAEPSAEAAQQFWRELRCERLRPQVRLLLESLNESADPPSACRRETEELKRIRMNPDRTDAERFARDMTCAALKPQAARLLESLTE